MESNRTDEKTFTAAPETKLHFLDYWRIIRIRKAVILAVFLLVSLTTAVVTYLLPPVYSSKVIISLEKDAPDIAPNMGSVYLSTVIDPFFIQTEFQRIQSRPVLNKVVEQLKLRETWAQKYKIPGTLTPERAYDLLKGAVRVSQSHNTQLIEIEALSDNMDEAATLANAVAKAYKEVRQTNRTEVAQGGLKNLREQLALKKEAIGKQQQEVNRLRNELKISDQDAFGTAPSPSLDQEQLRHFHLALHDAQGRLVIASNKFMKLSRLTRDQLKDAAPMQTGGDSRLSELIAQENSTEQKLTVLKSQAGANHPDVKSMNLLFTTIQNELNGALTGIVFAVQVEMETQQAAVEFYTASLERAKSQDAENFPKFRPYYEAKELLNQMKSTYDRVEQNLEIAEIEAQAPTKNTVQVIEPAVPEPVPAKPKKKLYIGIGVGIGLMIGILLAFFIEYLDTSVKTIDDVERALQAAVLGVIPQNVGVLLDEGPESPHAEAYRVLRTNVLFSRKDPKLNTLTVVSGGAGEGKSTTVFNLATVFAQNGQRVLVVDSDLRRPSLHKYLRISNSIGLTNYLLKQNTLEEVIQTTSQQNLDFMPSGRLPSSSMGILSSMQMKELIRDVKRRYDFVFFDSPPIMGVSDASILASEVDMVLQVIQYRRYPQPMTIRAKQMIEKVGGNLLGIVLNNINVSQDENYYYYSGYYYDYYAKGEYGEYKSGEYRSGEYSSGEYRSREKRSGKEESEKPAEAGGKNGEDAKVEIKSKF